MHLYFKSGAVALLALWLSGDDAIEQSFHAGQQALQAQHFAVAKDEFTKVLALDPTLIEAEVNLGLAYQGLLDYDAATRHLTKALRQRPDLPGPNLIVGMDYLKLGSPERAIPFLQHTLKLESSNLDAREALASAYLGRDDFGNAADQYRQIALLSSDKSEAWFRLGHQYLDLAAQLAYRGAHLYPDSPWGHRFLGDLLFGRDRWQDAIDEYQKALTAQPQQPGLHTAIGYAYLRAAKLEDSDAQFRAELHLDLRSESAWIGLANAQILRGQAISALNSLQKAWEIAPEFVALQREFPSGELPQESAKASILSVQGEPEGAAKHFLLAALFASTDDRASAEREWKSFTEDYAKLPHPEGGDACKAHRYAACIQSLQGRKNLKNSERLLLGEALFTLQQNDAAADALAQVHGTPLENAEASYWLERTYQAQGAETYARLEESFPNSWRTYQLRAEGFALRGNLRDAVKEFQAALALRPNEPELHEALGELYLDHSDKDSAQSELEQTLALDPSRTHALYLLGRVHVENKENEKAVPYLERAVRLQPNLAEANSLLGTAYLRLGQTVNAIPKLEKAAASDHYGNVHYQLYMAYRKLGNPERAQKELTLSQNLRRSYLERDQALIMGSPQSVN